MTYRIAIGASSFAAEDDTPRRMLEAAGVDVSPNPFGRRLTEDETITFLRDIDGLLAGLEPLNRRVLSSAGGLKAVARVGIGMDNVDVDAARELGIKVSNTPDAPAQAVSEMTVGVLLALCRQLLPTNRSVHAGNWKKTIGIGLVGLKVLLVGYGRIGRRVATLLRPFGAEILVADPFVDEATLAAGDRLLPLREGLRAADVVSLHAGGVETILRADEFVAMRDGVILLNSARGELVDEDALIGALESGKVAATWFDAFWEEPYRGRLCAFEQALLTPHTGTYTRQCRLEMETQAVRNLLRDLGIRT